MHFKGNWKCQDMNTQLEFLQISRGVKDSFLQWFILTVCDYTSLKIKRIDVPEQMSIHNCKSACVSHTLQVAGEMSGCHLLD